MQYKTPIKNRDGDQMPTIVKIGLILMLTPFFLIVSAPFLLIIVMIFGWMLESLFFTNGILAFTMSLGVMIVWGYFLMLILRSMAKGGAKRGVKTIAFLRDFMQFSLIPRAWYPYFIFFVVVAYFSTYMIFSFTLNLFFHIAEAGFVSTTMAMSLYGMFLENTVALTVITIFLVYVWMQYSANKASREGRVPTVPLLQKLFIICSPILGFLYMGFLGRLPF